MKTQLVFALASLVLIFSAPAHAETCSSFHGRCIASTQTHVVGSLPANVEPKDEPVGKTVRGVGSAEKCDIALKACLQTGEWTGPVTKRVHSGLEKK